MGRRLGKRVGGSAYWRIGVWGSKTALRRGYHGQEPSKELMTLSNAHTPSRRPAHTFPLAASGKMYVISGTGHFGHLIDETSKEIHL